VHDENKKIRLAAVLRDIGLVSFGKYGQYAVTVVTVPLIARVLGAEGLGLLSIGLSSYFIGSVLVDLGITQFLSAMMHSENVDQLRGNYLVIRTCILSTIGIALFIGLSTHVGPHLQMILLGLFVGGFWSMSEDWVLVGQARFGSSMAYQGVGRIAYLLLLVLVLPRHPHAAVALLCMLFSSSLTVGLTWRDSLRTFGRPARPRNVLTTVRLGVSVLISRLLEVSYGQGSTTVYSSVLDAASLGLFSAGDRLVRAIQSLIDPIGFALLPRIARLDGDRRFWNRAIRALLACVCTASVISLAVWVAAPTLIGLIYGPGFAGATPLIRIEAFILPATAFTSFVTTAILPARKDAVGVLIGSVIGTSVAVAWLYVAVRTHSVWALVWGTLNCEVVMALYYVVRMWRLQMLDQIAVPNKTARQAMVAVRGEAAP